MNLKKLLNDYFTEAVRIRRYLHMNPELSDCEFNTTKLIKNELIKSNIEILDIGLETGVVGIIRGNQDGKTLMIREDIDALPILEETNLDFASRNKGISHTCGHDIHTAILIYVANVLSHYRNTLSGNVIFLFQPSEESATGAKKVVSKGLMDMFDVDKLIGVHCSPEIDKGKIGVIKGPANASTDLVKIIVKGKGGHGAHPYNTIDPIITSGYLLTQLQTIVSRENKPTYPIVLTFGIISGGTAPNVIPNEVVLNGTLRSLNNDYRNRAKDSIVRITKNCCQAMRGEGIVEFSQSIPPLINDSETIDLVKKAVTEIISENAIFKIELPSMGSDDFSVLLKKSKSGAQIRVGTGNEDDFSRMGLHNSKNIFDEEAIYTGAATLVQFALNYLKR